MTTDLKEHIMQRKITTVFLCYILVVTYIFLKFSFFANPSLVVETKQVLEKLANNIYMNI